MNALRYSLLALFALATGLAQAATYRWVDEKGGVHYGDTIPPQQSDLGHQELDKQGRVLMEAPRTRLTPAERKHQQEEEARREAEKRQADEQARRDRALLSSYTSEAEIDLVRDRALELEATHMNGLKIRLKAAEEKMTSANSQIKTYESRQEAPPKTLQQMREEALDDMTYVNDLIHQREKSIAELKTRYEADKIRFRELTGIQ